MGGGVDGSERGEEALFRVSALDGDGNDRWDEGKPASLEDRQRVFTGRRVRFGD